MTTKVVPVTQTKRLTAKVLSKELSGSHIERIEEEKTMVIKYHRGMRPEIFFTGFWGGLDIKAILRTIPRAYRLRRREMTRPVHQVVTEPLKVEGRKEKGDE